jgi:signal transduction histidine kinase
MSSIETAEHGALPRAVLGLTVGLWLFCFASYYAVTFLWTNWAPPAWLLAFNALVTLSGFAISLGVAAVLVRFDPRGKGHRRIWAVGLVVAGAFAQTLADQQIWRELVSQFLEATPRPASLVAVLSDFGRALSDPIGAMRLLTYLWLFGLYAAAVLLLLEVRDGRRRQRRLVETQQMVQHAQLAALRYQLDPHFLFNCLNNVSSLIVTGRATEAEDMMMKLSDLLRTTLTTDPHLPTRLADELETVMQYLAIEEVRFSDGLDTVVECPEDLWDAVVPGFILQPLAENAVKHSAGRPTIAIVAQRRQDLLVLSVANPRTGPRDDRPAASLHVGLANIRQRLEALYGPAGVLEIESAPEEYVARVILPLTFKSGPERG